MKRAARLVAYTLAVIILVVGTTVLLHTLLPLRPSNEIRYVDLVTIILTALAIMITILGLFVAALGIIGWTTFETKLRDNSLSYLASELSKDGQLRKEFETILTKLSLQGVRPDESEQSQESSAQESAERPYND